MESVQDISDRARAWFSERVPRRAEQGESTGRHWSVAIFNDTGPEEEIELLAAARDWHARKWDAQLAGLDWSKEYGGWGLTRDHADAVAAVEADFDVPHHELMPITTRLMAPTLRLMGTDEQRQRFVAGLARADIMCAQLFSEPSAGSDLAGIATRAQPADGGWVITGQKVWSSGAQLAEWGLLLARTDVTLAKHSGITAFLLPLDADGVLVRPLRQMTGGSCFNEVFLEEVHIPDELRVGAIGDGWKVATTVLGFERDASGDDTTLGGSWIQVLALAEAMGRRDDPVVRPMLSDVYTRHVLARVASARDLEDRRRGLPRGPEGSMRKLQWVNGLTQISDTVTEILGPRLVADTAEPETYAWNEHVMGALGYRIGGGTDQIQRSIIAQRILGLPSGPRADRGVPFKDIPT